MDSKLISFQWFSNHYKWLVWKLAALEVCFPEAVGGRSVNILDVGEPALYYSLFLAQVAHTRLANGTDEVPLRSGD